MNTKKLFIRFLKENNIYEKYKYNMDNSKHIFWHRKYPDYDLEKFLDDKDGNQLIDSFSWVWTKDGDDFWHNINDSWNKVLYYMTYHRNKFYDDWEWIVN